MAGALNYAPMISSSDSNGLVVGGGGGRGSDDAAVREQWEVEFSRFFPSRRRKTRPSPSSRVEQLGILRRRKTDRNGGSWVFSSCPVNLHLIKRCSGSVPIIVVCCRGRIYEEHFVSNLHFSWPQVSCVVDCPRRGCRVILASYKDRSGQVEKFAMRFTTSSAAQEFLNTLKESLKDTSETEYLANSYSFDHSSQSEHVASTNELQYRANDSNFPDLNPSHAPAIPSFNSNDEQQAPSQQPLCFNFNDEQQMLPQQPLLLNIEASSALPPSFTQLLDDSSIENRSAAETTRTTGANEVFHSSQVQQGIPVSSFQEITPQSKSVQMDDGTFKSQLALCMLDSSFHDMLLRIESVIDDLGGDLML